MKQPSNNIQKSLDKPEKLQPDQRRCLIRVVCGAILKITKKPGHKNLELIAARMVTKCKCLQYVICGTVVGKGHSGVACYLGNRMDNQSRDSSHLRKKRTREDDAETTTTVEVPDPYGCINWLPAEYPPSENNGTQKAHKQWLLSLPCFSFIDV